MTARMRRSGTSYRAEASAISRECARCPPGESWSETPGVPGGVTAVRRYATPSRVARLATLATSAFADVAAAIAAVTARPISQRGPELSMAGVQGKSDTGPETQTYQHVL